jgi:hypothetical protein
LHPTRRWRASWAQAIKLARELEAESPALRVVNTDRSAERIVRHHPEPRTLAEAPNDWSVLNLNIDDRSQKMNLNLDDRTPKMNDPNLNLDHEQFCLISVGILVDFVKWNPTR